MVENTKQVRVDNWGIYFLQRLQLFFSKTDYCDLTLQFEGNVQLKVHRLVMNACTEYFAFLEQTCPALGENTIMMPGDLQADVIVPIVNFMYTGMLEYHPSIFDKLFKAAEMMNIAVLTKLLEAQVQPSKTTKKKVDSPIIWNSQVKKSLPLKLSTEVASPGRKLPTFKRRSIQTPIQMTSHSVTGKFPESKWSAAPPEKDSVNAPKPTRFEWPDDDLPPINLMDSSFDDISLTSKPLWTKEEEQQRAGPSSEDSKSESGQNFEHQNNTTDDEFVKEQKANPVEGEDHNNQKRKNDLAGTVVSPKRVKVSDKENSETTINIKGKNTTDLDHTKIVSEILKKYPGLVKKNKNIRLKIMTKPETAAPAAKTISTVANNKPKVSPPAEVKSKKELKESNPPVGPPSIPKKMESYVRKVSDDGPWICMKCFGDSDRPEFVLYYLFRKHMTDVHNEEFDSSLCKYCGHHCPTDVTMAFHLYTKHGLKPPSSISFSKCPKCPFIAISSDRVAQHILQHGKDEVQCLNCKLGFRNKQCLLDHIKITGHPNKNAVSISDCQYCMKKLQSSVSLFTHIKSQHLKDAKADGIVSLDESLEVQPNETTKLEEKEVQSLQKDKVKIISNVKVAESSQPKKEEEEEQRLENPAEPQTLSAVNVPPSLASNLGLVDIVVLDDNQQYILQQPRSQTGQSEFILPELASNEALLQAANAELNSTDELVMVLTDHDYQDEEQHQGPQDNSNIVVLYSHPVEGQQGQFITSQGNLMVNSQTGMLEIHNGTAITTTAGQIIVSEPVTTDSTVESIEMIRKEIENHKTKLVTHETEQPKIQAPVAPVVEENQVEKVEESRPVEPEPQIDQATKDLPDSVQEEPMEVEEIGPGSSSHDVQQCLPELQQAEANEIVTEQGEDVPPVTDTAAHQDTRDSEGANENVNTSVEENLMLSDAASFIEPQYHEEVGQDVSMEEQPQEIVEAGEVTESMEINGSEEKQSEDVVDNKSPIEEPSPEKPQTPPIQSQPESEHKPDQDQVEPQIENENSRERPQEEEEEDSLQSPTDKDHRNVNQTILADWDDTDSQQSEKQASVSDAVVKDPAHVSKLMDDWDEEEEEEKKTTEEEQ